MPRPVWSSLQQGHWVAWVRTKSNKAGDKTKTNEKQLKQLALFNLEKAVGRNDCSLELLKRRLQSKVCIFFPAMNVTKWENCLRLCQGKIRKNFFIERVAKFWKGLTRELVYFSSLEEFKRHGCSTNWHVLALRLSKSSWCLIWWSWWSSTTYIILWFWIYWKNWNI